MFEPVVNLSMLGRGQKKGLLEFEFIDLRQFGIGKHQTVDGKLYGGGAGLLLRVDVLAEAIKSIDIKPNSQVLRIMTAASGQLFKQSQARELSENYDHIIIICGHYEGVDQRFIDKYIDLELSIGDFVLTGGEIPAMAIIDSIARLVPGVIEKPEATLNESFENQLLENPQYTRPDIFEDVAVPEVLKSGHHGQVEQWRVEQQKVKTAKNRPDLLKD